MINPLQTTQLHPGIVSMRVAFMLRYAEIFPANLRFVFLYLFEYDDSH